MAREGKSALSDCMNRDLALASSASGRYIHLLTYLLADADRVQWSVENAPISRLLMQNLYFLT